MSYDAMRFVRDALTHVRGADRAILRVLAERSNWTRSGQDECWPSIDTIASDAGLHRQTVIRHLPALVEAGFIVKYPRGRGFTYVVQTPGDFWCEARVAAHGEGPCLRFGPVVHTRLGGRRRPAAYVARGSLQRSCDQRLRASVMEAPSLPNHKEPPDYDSEAVYVPSLSPRPPALEVPAYVPRLGVPFRHQVPVSGVA